MIDYVGRVRNSGAVTDRAVSAMVLKWRTADVHSYMGPLTGSKPIFSVFLND